VGQPAVPDPRPPQAGPLDFELLGGARGECASGAGSSLAMREADGPAPPSLSLSSPSLPRFPQEIASEFQRNPPTPIPMGMPAPAPVHFQQPPPQQPSPFAGGMRPVSLPPLRLDEPPALRRAACRSAPQVSPMIPQLAGLGAHQRIGSGNVGPGDEVTRAPRLARACVAHMRPMKQVRRSSVDPLAMPSADITTQLEHALDALKCVAFHSWWLGAFRRRDERMFVA
jgi:hypothetical protein